jgi:hypothetical protein
LNGPYAYFCFDPRDGEVFYVGKGRGQRAFRHIDGRSQNYLVTRRVAQIRRAGLTPLVEMIPAKTDAEAFALEHWLIAQIGRKDLGQGPLLNLTDGGDGPNGRVFSDAEKAAISARLTGRPVSAETRAKASATNKAKVDDAYRAGVSERLKGRPVSATTRAKISAAGRGRKHSPETIAKRADSNRGKTRSAETKARMSAAQRGHTVSDSARQKLREAALEQWRRKRGAA